MGRSLMAFFLAGAVLFQPALAHLPHYMKELLNTHREADDPYVLYCCTTSPEEYEKEIMLNVTRGKIPAFLKGDFFKMAGGMLELGGKAFGHQFDAFAKVHKFRFPGDGTVGFTSRFLKSKFYNDSIKAGTIVPGLLMGATDPPFHGPQFYEAFVDLPDNTLINAWAVGEDTFLTTTDFAKYTEIDRQTVATRGAFQFNDGWNNMVSALIPTMSCAHTQYVGGGGSTKEGKTSINFLGEVSPRPFSGIGMNIVIYRQLWGSKVREAISQTVHLDAVPLIHSFGVTSKYMIVLVHPVEMKLMETMNHPGPAATSAIHWVPNSTTKIMVLDIEGAQDEKLGTPKDFKTFTTPGFFTVHHINTYEEGNKLIAQTVCYDDGNFFSPESGVGFIKVEKNITKRLSRPSMKFCHVEVDFDSGEVSVRKRPSGLDKDGQEWGMEMPRYNDEWQGKKTCFFYGIGMKMNKTNMVETGFTQSIVKSNVCDDTPGNVIPYTKHLHYAWEAVFVSNGGPAEDDGVLMVATMDGERKTSYLVILDAKDMSEIAVTYLPDGVRIPNQLHSRWFPYDQFPLPAKQTNQPRAVYV